MTRRMLTRAALVATTWCATHAGAADLVFHQGFETCWSPALTKPQFLTAVRTSIDGQGSCIPPVSGNQSGVAYAICSVANGCGNGVAGCAVALQADAFSGDFAGGSFTGPGTASTIAVPIDASFLGTCTLTISAISIAYALDYLMRDDGTDGVFTDDLLTPQVDIVSYTSNNNCNALIAGAIASYLPQAIASAQSGAATAIEPGLRADTLERSICPLSAP